MLSEFIREVGARQTRATASLSVALWTRQKHLVLDLDV